MADDANAAAAVKEEAKSAEAATTEVKEEQTDQAQQNQADEDDRKLFVGALPQSCPESDIRTYFSQFGEIENINLKTDQMTGRSRGFCFVVFKAVESLDKAVASDKHEMGGKKLAVKKAQAKQGKVHVGKLPKGTEEDAIREFFQSYGNIVTIEYPYDKIKSEKKNFCFVTFDREDPAKRLIKEGSVQFNGAEVVINKVTPKPNDGNMGGGGRGGGRGGMMGGRGGMGGGMGMGMQGGWGYQQGGWGGGGYGDYYGYDPYSYGGGQGGWGGGYGGGWDGGYGGQGGGYGGGKAPRGRGGGRGRGGRGGGMRSKPY